MTLKGMYVSLRYWEFDFEGVRHHCVEMPVPRFVKFVWLLTGVRCVYGACDDHHEVFCMVHQGESIVMDFTNAEKKALHDARVLGERSSY